MKNKVLNTLTVFAVISFLWGICTLDSDSLILELICSGTLIWLSIYYFIIYLFNK